MPTILVVDDEQSILNSIKRLFSDDESIEIVTSISATLALDILDKRKGQIDLVISDERMPELSGSEFLTRVREKHPRVYRIILTGYADQAATIKAINDAEVFRYVSKPWDPAALRSTVRDVLEIKHLKDRGEQLSLKVLSQKNELEKLNAELEKTVALRTEQLRKSLEALKIRNHQLNQQRTGVISLLAAILSIHDPAKARMADRISNAWHRVSQLVLPAQSEDAQAAAQLSAWILDPKLPYLQFLSSIEGFEAAAKFLMLSRENMNGSGPNKMAQEQIPAESRLIRILYDHYTLNPDQETLSRQYILSRAATIYDANLANQFYSNTPIESSHTLLPVPVDNLLDGMIVGADITLSNGAILLTSGAILNDKTITQLKRISHYLSQQVVGIDTRTKRDSGDE